MVVKQYLIAYTYVRVEMRDDMFSRQFVQRSK